jgi:hypothetical protein
MIIETWYYTITAEVEVPQEGGDGMIAGWALGRVRALHAQGQTSLRL